MSHDYSEFWTDYEKLKYCRDLFLEYHEYCKNRSALYPYNHNLPYKLYNHEKLEYLEKGLDFIVTKGILINV